MKRCYEIPCYAIYHFGINFAQTYALHVLIPLQLIDFVGEERKVMVFGILVFVCSISSVLVGPIVGYFSDRLKRRLPFVLVGTLFLGISLPIVSSITSTALFWLYLLLCYIAQVCYMISMTAYVRFFIEYLFLTDYCEECFIATRVQQE